MRSSLFGASQRRGGFTLVELIIVVAIMGIVAMVAVPKVLSTLDSARVNSAQTSVVQLQLGLERYYVDNQSYPPSITSFDQLANLVSAYTPVDAKLKDYTFLGYVPYDNKQNMNPCTTGQRCWYYTLAVQATDHASTPIQITPEKVEVVDLATVKTASAAPTQVVATGTSWDTMSITWMGSALAASYKVYRSPNPITDVQQATLVASGLTDLQYTDTGLTPNQTVHYVVVAVNVAGASAPSADAMGTTLPPPPPPTTPGNLVATPDGESRIALTWSASTSAAKVTYKVYRSVGTIASTTGAPIYTGEATMYTDAGLEPSTTYAYAAIASNLGGDSVPSASATATTGPPTSPPPAPANLVATAPSYDKVQLQWDATLKATTSYNLYRSLDSSFTSSVKFTVSTNSFTDTGLSASTDYYYKVSAVNVAGESAFSAPATVKTPAPPAPTLTATAQSDTGVKLTWNSNAWAQSYNIYRKSGNQSFTPDPSNRIATGVTGTLYTDGGLSPYTSYTYVVGGVYANGEVFSQAKSVTTLPSAPTGLQSSNVSSTQATLSWTPDPSAAGYKLYRGTTPGSYTAITGTITSPSFADTGLVSTNTYYYVVTAIRGALESLFSNMLSVTTAPTAPTNPTATLQGNGDIKVTWNAVPNATGYKVYLVSPSPGTPPDTVIGTLSAGVTTFTHASAGLQAGKTYTYVVTALGGTNGESNRSAPASADTAPPALAAAPTATVQSGRINLSWNASTGATGYNVYRGAASTFTPDPASRVGINVGGTSFIDNTAAGNTAYYYKVTAVRNLAESAPSPSSAQVISPLLPPTGVVGKPKAGNKVALSWSGTNTGATSYKIYRSTTQSFTPPAGTLVNGNVLGTQYTDTAPASNTTYYYYVTSVNGSGESGVSNQVSVKTLTTTSVGNTPKLYVTTAPAQFPKNLSFSNPNTGQSSWDPIPASQSARYQISGITGTVGSGATFSLTFGNAGNTTATVKVTITYDFYGDGSLQRVETYDKLNVSSQNSGTFTPASAGVIRSDNGQALADFDMGKVYVDVYTTSSTAYALSGGSSPSTVTLPYTAVSQSQ